MKPATEILLSAAFVLTPEENWTKGANTRDCHGVPYPAPHRVACYCVDGAMKAAMKDCGLSFGSYEKASSALSRVTKTIYPYQFNDTPERTHAEVLAALYKAAELSEAT